MTRKQIREIAKLYCRNLLTHACGSGCDDPLFSIDDLEIFHKEVEVIADKIEKTRTHCGTLEECILHVINR